MSTPLTLGHSNLVNMDVSIIYSPSVSFNILCCSFYNKSDKYTYRIFLLFLSNRNIIK